MRLYIAPHLGAKRRLDKLSVRDVREWLTSWAPPASAVRTLGLAAVRCWGCPGTIGKLSDAMSGTG